MLYNSVRTKPLRLWMDLGFCREPFGRTRKLFSLKLILVHSNSFSMQNCIRNLSLFHVARKCTGWRMSQQLYQSHLIDMEHRALESPEQPLGSIHIWDCNPHIAGAVTRGCGKYLAKTGNFAKYSILPPKCRVRNTRNQPVVETCINCWLYGLSIHIIFTSQLVFVHALDMQTCAPFILSGNIYIYIYIYIWHAHDAASTSLSSLQLQLQLFCANTRAHR